MAPSLFQKKSKGLTNFNEILVEGVGCCVGVCCVDSFGSCSFKFVHYNVFKLVPTNQVTTPKEELIAWQSRPMEIVARWLSNNSLSSCILNFDQPIFQVYLV